MFRLLAATGGVLLAMAAPATALTFSLAPGSPVKVGDGTYDVAVGDFNSDGKLDVVAANQSSDTVSVLLGDGLGGLSPAAGSPLAAPREPAALAVGDVNGDHRADFVAVGHYPPGTAHVMLGDGGGQFTPASGSPVAIGGDPGGIVLRDLNGDGKLDIASSNYGGDNVRVMFGDGQGGFANAPGSPFAAGSRPYSIAAGDFNGDGKPDLAAANWGSSGGGSGVSVLIGDASGGFAAPVALPGGLYPRGVAAGDLNSDGTDDLVASNYYESELSVLLSRSGGGFAVAPGSPFSTLGTTHPAGANPYSVVTGDLDANGTVDLVTANSSGKDVTVLLGDGSGGLRVAPGATFRAGAPVWSVALGDFNGDSRTDLVTANHQGDVGTPGEDTAGSVSVLLNVPPPEKAAGGGGDGGGGGGSPGAGGLRPDPTPGTTLGLTFDITRPVIAAARVAAVRASQGKARVYTIRLRASDRESGLSKAQLARGRHHSRQVGFHKTLHVRLRWRPTGVRVKDRAGNWSSWRPLAAKSR